MNWTVLVFATVGTLAVVFFRPWRFFWARDHCPQCHAVLARWNVWGWKEDWACRNCGCHINR